VQTNAVSKAECFMLRYTHVLPLDPDGRQKEAMDGNGGGLAGGEVSG